MPQKRTVVQARMPMSRRQSRIKWSLRINFGMTASQQKIVQLATESEDRL